MRTDNPISPPELDDDALERFGRQVILPDIGEAGQHSLAAATVVLVGCGALGSSTAMMLAAAGVGAKSQAGQMILFDNDTIEASNLHRQFAYDDHSVGMRKVMALAERMRAVFPDADIDPRPFFADSAQIQEAMLHKPAQTTVLIDASDNIVARAATTRAATAARIPLVWGAVAGFEARVSARRHAADPCFFCWFPDPAIPEHVARCDVVGVIGPAAHLAASWMAWRVMQLLLGLEDDSLSQLRVDDMRHGRSDQFAMAARRDCLYCSAESE